MKRGLGIVLIVFLLSSCKATVGSTSSNSNGTNTSTTTSQSANEESTNKNESSSNEPSKVENPTGVATYKKSSEPKKTVKKSSSGTD